MRFLVYWVSSAPKGKEIRGAPNLKVFPISDILPTATLAWALQSLLPDSPVTSLVAQYRVSHRHIRTMPHFATYCGATIVRYPTNKGKATHPKNLPPKQKEFAQTVCANPFCLFSAFFFFKKKKGKRADNLYKLFRNCV